MKHYLALSALALSALLVSATDYSRPLKVFVNGTQVHSGNATVNLEQQSSGKYTLKLSNFEMGAAGAVGTITVADIDSTICASTTCLNGQQTIKIASGDDASKTWIGPSLGDVPAIMKGELSGDSLNAILNIFMPNVDSASSVRIELGNVSSMGQVPNSSFDDFHTESVNVSRYTYREEQANHWHSLLNAETNMLALYAIQQHCYKSTDVREGATGNCLEVRSNTANTISINGTATTGCMRFTSDDATNVNNCAFLSFGYTETDSNEDPYYTIFNSRPDSLQVWVKYKVGARAIDCSDSCKCAAVSAIITDGTYYQEPEAKTYTNVVAKANNAAIASNDNTWQLVKIPFTYTENSVDPKAILVNITTCAIFGGGSTSRNDPDIILIDDLSLIYNANIKSIKLKGKELSGNGNYYTAEYVGDLTADDFEVEPVSKHAYVSKRLFEIEGGYLCEIQVVSNDLKTSNVYYCKISNSTTSINDVPTSTVAGVKAIYNLNGQRVSSMSNQGVYIVEKTDGTTTKVIKK